MKRHDLTLGWRVQLIAICLLSTAPRARAAAGWGKARTLVPGLVALACLLVAAPVTAQINYAVSGGTAYVASSPNASGNIVIASTYNDFPVTSIRDYAFLHRTGLTRVTVPASVTSIGGGAFLNCTNLTNVTFLGNPPTLFPDLQIGGLTQFVNTGPGAKVYYHCGTTGWGATFGGLPTVMLCPPQVNYAVSGDTAYVTRSPNASGDVVIASTYNGFPVTSIAGFAFTNCTSLTSVTIPNSVTSIGYYAFSRCLSLTSVSIPNSVTCIEFKAFYTCTNLTSVTIPNSITSLGPVAFEGCTSLTNFSVDAASPAYSSLDGVLFNKAQTTLIAYPGGRAGRYVIPDRVTSIEQSGFMYCGSLTSLTIPNSVTSIGSSAFWHCTSLTSLTFLGNAPGNPGGGFYNVGAGATVYYYCGATGWGATYAELPTVMLCPPQIAPGSAGMKPGGFGFTLTRLTNQTVVEASTDLLNWQPIWTNTQPGASAEFLDPQALPNRFYRARSN